MIGPRPHYFSSIHQRPHTRIKMDFELLAFLIGFGKGGADAGPAQQRRHVFAGPLVRLDWDRFTNRFERGFQCCGKRQIARYLVLGHATLAQASPINLHADSSSSASSKSNDMRGVKYICVVCIATVSSKAGLVNLGSRISKAFAQGQCRSSSIRRWLRCSSSCLVAQPHESAVSPLACKPKRSAKSFSR